MLSPELKLASTSDLPEIMAVEQDCFRSPWSEADLESCIGRGGSSAVRTWLAISGGETAGYVTATLDRNGLHLVSLGVRGDYRRKGIGAFLAGIAEGWGERLGAGVSRLEHRASAVPAAGLYRSLGYRMTGVAESYYPDGESARILERKLHPDRTRAGIAGAIVTRWGGLPPVGVVLGSGLSWLVEAFAPGPSIPYRELPGFAHQDLAGHPGELRLSGCGRFVFLMGRRHGYQGFSGDEIALLPGILTDTGVSTWILTSASGAVDPSLRLGDGVVFMDHVNCSGFAPAGIFGRTGGSVYSRHLREVALKAAGATGAPVHSGIFACASGPSYETSSEILMLRERGVSTVSMSTVPEALLLASMGCDVAAVSMVTNAAVPGAKVTHEEVLGVQELIREKQEEFLREFLEGAAACELP